MSDHGFCIFRKPYSSVKYVAERLTKFWEKHKLPAENLAMGFDVIFLHSTIFLLKFKLEPHQNQT